MIICGIPPPRLKIRRFKLPTHKVKFPAFADADKLLREALAANLSAGAVVNTSKVVRAGRPPNQYPVRIYADAVGKQLSEYLHLHGLTRRDFAGLVGIPLHRINALLCKGNGDYSKTVPLPVLVAVATAIDYDLNEFKDLFLKGNQDV